MILLLLANMFGSATADLGDRLVRAAGIYDSMPITKSAAEAAGFKTASSACVPDVGVVYYDTANGLPSEHKPLGLGFTPFGQLTSLTINIYGSGVPASLVTKGWWNQNSSNAYSSLTVSLRSTTDSCSTTTLSDVIGDRIVVNKQSLNWTIPTSNKDPIIAKYYRLGSCVKKMGTHYLYDLAKPTGITFLIENLSPVVPMYDPFSGQLNGIFFLSADVQQGLTSTNYWDIIPLYRALMCKNVCEPKCTFDDEYFMSTMHVFFKDPVKFGCNGFCDALHCCPDKENLRYDVDATDTVAKQSSSAAVVATSLVAIVAIFAGAI